MGASDLARQAAGQSVAAKNDEPKTVFGYMKAHKDQIAIALPKHMTPDRMVRVATTCFRTIPKLLECSPESLFGAIIQCAQLGLEPGNGLGHAYLLPFEKKKKTQQGWITERVDVQLIIGYRGMLDLARRSGQIESISAYAVYEGDKFECVLGLNPSLTHEPDWKNSLRNSPQKIVFVYAVAKLKDGGVQFQVMSRADVEQIRARSKAKDSGPWVSDYEQMALKTVTRRLFKWLPVSIEMQQAVAIDEQAERGQQYVFDEKAIDGDFVRTSEPESIDDSAPTLNSVLVLIETASTPDDWSLIQDLSNSLSPEDRLFVSGEAGKKNPEYGMAF